MSVFGIPLQYDKSIAELKHAIEIVEGYRNTFSVLYKKLYDLHYKYCAIIFVVYDIIINNMLSLYYVAIILYFS